MAARCFSSVVFPANCCGVAVLPPQIDLPARVEDEPAAEKNGPQHAGIERPSSPPRQHHVAGQAQAHGEGGRGEQRQILVALVVERKRDRGQFERMTGGPLPADFRGRGGRRNLGNDHRFQHQRLRQFSAHGERHADDGSAPAVALRQFQRGDAGLLPLQRLDERAIGPLPRPPEEGERRPGRTGRRELPVDARVLVGREGRDARGEDGRARRVQRLDDEGPARPVTLSTDELEPRSRNGDRRRPADPVAAGMQRDEHDQHHGVRRDQEGGRGQPPQRRPSDGAGRTHAFEVTLRGAR